MPSVPISQNVTACSVLATFHQPAPAAHVLLVGLERGCPSTGTASCSPLIGETMRGM